MKKGFVPSEMSVQRIVDWGQVTDLTSDFKLPDNYPFSVFVRPKAETSESSVIISARPYQSYDFKPTPVVLESWMENMIITIEAGAIDLEAYDVWWGAGRGF